MSKIQAAVRQIMGADHVTKECYEAAQEISEQRAKIEDSIKRAAFLLYDARIIEEEDGVMGPEHSKAFRRQAEDLLFRMLGIEDPEEYIRTSPAASEAT